MCLIYYLDTSPPPPPVQVQFGKVQCCQTFLNSCKIGYVMEQFEEVQGGGRLSVNKRKRCGQCDVINERNGCGQSDVINISPA